LLELGSSQAGSHEVVWTGVDRNGSSVASGIYFYRLEFSSTDEKRVVSQARRMLLIK
jgi:hypothetical protein